MKLSLKPLVRFSRPKVGALPGTLAVPPEAPVPTISLIRFSSTESESFQEVPVQEIASYLNTKAVTWIDVQGLGDEKILKDIANLFGISALALGDIVNVPQRPKAEYFDEELLVVTKMIRVSEAYQLNLEQVSIYLKGDVVITFQERPGDVFDPIRRRLKRSKGPLRTGDAAYLLYSLLDTVIDSYFPTLETMGDYIQQLEHHALSRPNRAILQRISDLKNQLSNFRRVIWPQREVLQAVLANDGEVFNEICQRHLRDALDHVTQANEINEMYREMASNLIHLSMSVISNRTNDQMKVLTVMASIFIPLTFIAGVYGMNFEHMPELHYRWAYPAVWATMVASALGSLVYFFRKGWIVDSQASVDPFDLPRDQRSVIAEETKP